ncbi:hypothetical protein H2248_002001 [Termitomyces sp. 'cryptogamus']|nr:hypothetical protein H2248_002001 [Termitomyces sp. 'cryptogamus']
MSSSTESLQGIDLSKTFAPIYWGFVVSLLLGGITIVQSYIYFLAARRDQPREWVTALCMLLLDLTSSGLVAQSVYYYLIPNFGSLLPLDSVTSELSTECLISTIITFISQMYFVYQLYIVQRLGTRRWGVLGSISGCALMACAGGIACVTSMYIFRHGVLSNRSKMFAIFFGVAKGFGTLTDILATIAMCLYLTSSRTGIAEMNTLVNRVITFVIHRGVLVTLIQALLLVTFYAAPDNLYWFAFHVNVTKLYANTFFAMLNGRQHFKDRRQPHLSNRVPYFTMESTHTYQKNGFGNGDYDSGTIAPQEDQNIASPKSTAITKTVTVEIADI